VIKLNRDHAIGLVCIALGIAIYLVARTFPKATTGSSDLTGPSFYPMLLALVFLVCGGLEVASGIRKRAELAAIDVGDFLHSLKQPGPQNILIVTGLVFGFIVLLETLGFVVCSYVTLFILMWRFGVPWLRNLIYSAVFVVVLLFVFGKVFKISLPSGILSYIGL
jgi:putative tricarboxylic transport membrane protein